MNDRETVLAELPGTSETERVLLVHKLDAATQQSQLELRQQSWAPRIGWFTQSSVFLTPDQVGSLRLALGTGAARSNRPGRTTMPAPSARPIDPQPHPTSSFIPRIVRAETA
jgi:hypothetical protein